MQWLDCLKNQDIGSELVTVTDVNKLNILSNSIQNLAKKEKELDLNLKISNPETKDIIIPFQKKSTIYNKTDILQYNDLKKWRNWVLQLF